MSIPTYKANICATEGCQWRETQAAIKRLQEKIEHLETTIRNIKGYVATCSTAQKEAK